MARSSSFNSVSYPINPPAAGTSRYNQLTDCVEVWNGTQWCPLGVRRDTVNVPLPDELEKYPALRHAWNEFLVIKKLTGV